MTPRRLLLQYLSQAPQEVAADGNKVRQADSLNPWMIDETISGTAPTKAVIISGRFVNQGSEQINPCLNDQRDVINERVNYRRYYLREVHW